MYSSPKFLSPIVIVGFPAPAEPELLVLLDELDPVEDDLLEPHAASTNASANAATSAAAILHVARPLRAAPRLPFICSAFLLFTLFIENIVISSLL
jgi:hypothetical protein